MCERPWGLRRSRPIARAIAAALTLTSADVLPMLPARAEGCAAPTSATQQVELYFGASVKGRPFVTERAWSKFLDTEVTPRFPDGLTVFDAHGQWRSGDGRIYREATRVLLILYKADAASEGKIEALRDAYKKQFHQEDAPLRVDSTVCATF
ncbi:DUF3574 domain-containing protein [Roseiarcus sp.]|uniref:DUF3574 domain-containing protein n=1 Tax=Roseiarcus sp. TaxID=1969460 RepID=UPI003F9E87BF